MQIKHVALVSASLRGGGAERTIADLATALTGHGVQVDVVLVRAEGIYLASLSSKVKVIDLGAHRTLFSVFPLLRYLNTAQPEVILSTQAHVNAVLLLAKTMLRYPAKFIVRESSTLSAIASTSSGLKSAITSKLTRYAYRKARIVVAPSKGTAQDLVDYARVESSRIHTIPNPIDLGRFQKLSQEDVDLPFDPLTIPMVLAIGRLAPEKNFQFLIRSFAEVRKNTSAKLMILGDGPERRRLEDLITSWQLEDDVYLPGFQENPFPYLRYARVFVLSSIFEGLPNAMLQAAALEVPVISTDCPSGPSEILDGGRWGALVSIDDQSEMVDAILKGLNYLIKPVPLDWLTARYGIDTVVSQYMKLFVTDEVN